MFDLALGVIEEVIVDFLRFPESHGTLLLQFCRSCCDLYKFDDCAVQLSAVF